MEQRLRRHDAGVSPKQTQETTIQPPMDVDADKTNSGGQSVNVRLLDRLEHFTWAWYCFPMATGGLSLLLSEETQPHIFRGLQTIGKLVYIWDLTIFTLIGVSITYRFVRFPYTLKYSFTHPTESLFFATALLSLASIIAGISIYGIPACGPWLVTAFRVLFWIYFAVTLCQAVGQYFMLFTNPALKIEDMTPAWDLPIFPVMLTGTIAAAGAGHQTPDQAVPMIVAGLTAQGLGMMISILMYSSYFRRMIQFGFPSPNSRPGMFIAVGPPSFTSLAIIGMANNFPRAYHEYFGAADVTVQIFRAVATVIAVFLWSLSLWFFCISVLANIAARRQMTFHLNWWAFVFPNVGFTIATINIGKMFSSQGVLWVGSVMTIILVTAYLCVLSAHIRAVIKKDILWNGKDEDIYVKERKHKVETLHEHGKIEEAIDLENGRIS